MGSPDELQLTQLHQVAQNSADLERSIAFYRDKLGAKYIARFDPPGLAFFDFNGTRLLLEKGAASATLYFRVDDIRSAYEALRSRGISFDSEPHLSHRDENGTFGPAGAEEWMAFFRDPDDNILALASRTVL